MRNGGNIILHRFPAHADSITDITLGVGLCNSTIISCSLDCTCKFWNLSRGTHLKTVAFPCIIFGVALDPTKSEFHAVGSDGSVYKGTLKVGSKKLVSQWGELVKWTQKHDGAVISLGITNEGQNLVSAAEDGSVWNWVITTGEIIMALKNEMGSISDMVVSTGRISYGKGHGLGGTSATDILGNPSHFGRELSFPMKHTLEMEEILTLVAKDRSRVIDILESAIDMYEKLLELILKEAKEGTDTCSE